MARDDGIVIRPWEARDRDEVEALLRLLSEAAEVAGMDAPTYVAESGGSVVGMVTLCVFSTLTGPKAHLDHLVVAPRWRRRGIGRALVEHAIGRAEAVGASRIDLTASGAKRAGRALYRSLGFQQRETASFRLHVTPHHGRATVEAVTVPGASLWTASMGAGVPVVLAHGGPGLSNNLSPVARMLDDIARVHLYDQRGGGRSSAEGPFDVATFVADLDALREHWGHERWVVGGHSWGAVLALFYALAHPDRTLGVIYLAGTAIRWGFQDRVRGERMSRLTEAERQELETLSEHLRDGGDDRERARFLRLMWSTDFASPEAAAVLDEQPLYEFPRADAVARAVQRDWKRRFDDGVEDGLRRLPVPVLVLHGDRDPDPTGAREVAELAPRGEWAALEGAGHSPWLEQPAAMRQRLRAFVKSVASSATGVHPGAG